MKLLSMGDLQILEYNAHMHGEQAAPNDMVSICDALHPVDIQLVSPRMRIFTAHLRDENASLLIAAIHGVRNANTDAVVEVRWTHGVSQNAEACIKRHNTMSKTGAFRLTSCLLPLRAPMCSGFAGMKPFLVGRPAYRYSLCETVPLYRRVSIAMFLRAFSPPL